MIQKLMRALGDLPAHDASVTADERRERERLVRELEELKQRRARLVLEMAGIGVDAAVGDTTSAVFIPAARPRSTPSAQSDPGTRAERLAVQEALVLVAGYDAAIDGAFGERTVEAVRAFQRARGSEPTGRLTEAERAGLLEQADTVRLDYGFRRLEDAEIGYSLVYPANALSQTKSSSSSYRILADAEDDVGLQIVEVDSRDLKTLFDDLTGHEGVGYRRFGETWFVASGEVDDEMFYSMARRVEDGSIVVHLTYPLAERGFWDPYTVILYNSFVLLAER
jgi:hypothetical protein